MRNKFIEKLFYSPLRNMVRTPFPVAETCTVFSNCSCSHLRDTLLAIVRSATNTVSASLPQYSAGGGGATTAIVGAATTAVGRVV
jgi:hypothetical protein